MIRPLKIAYLTAGAAGMICGSCLHDNTLARALIKLGHDVQLIPLYTPIRTDEEDVSSSRVFYGGINMYLQQQVPLFRWLPRWMDGWLDRPGLINWATGGPKGGRVKIDPQQVADLTLSILRGREGFQRKEVERLAQWLTGELRPDVINFSNILTAGCVPEIKRRLNIPVVVTLQGDDIFLRDLPQPQQSQALTEIRRLVDGIDGFIANSRYYADHMSQYLGIPRERIEIVPLGIDTQDFVAPAPPLPVSPHRPLTIGYLARLAPEKGLHVLAEAFILLRQLPGMDNVRLKIGGWLGGKNVPYAEQIFSRLIEAGLRGEYEYVGEVDRQGKLELLGSIDLLCVPTTYREPKGLFVLESLAAGVPVVVPDHGAFPEVLAETGGGLLHPPDDPQHLAELLRELLIDAPRRQALGRAGREAVLTRRNQQGMAEQTAAVLGRAIQRNKPPAASAAEKLSAVDRA